MTSRHSRVRATSRLFNPDSASRRSPPSAGVCSSSAIARAVVCITAPLRRLGKRQHSLTSHSSSHAQSSPTSRYHDCPLRSHHFFDFSQRSTKSVDVADSHLLWYIGFPHYQLCRYVRQTVNFSCRRLTGFLLKVLPLQSISSVHFIRNSTGTTTSCGVGILNLTQLLVH